MVFSSLFFIFFFLPLNLLIYLSVKSIKAKNRVMLIFSLIFYAWGEPVYILLLVGMTFIDWWLSLRVSVCEKGSKKARLLLAGAVFADLLLLGIFKYGTFTLSNLKILTGFPQHIPDIMILTTIKFINGSTIITIFRGIIIRIILRRK